MARTPSDRDDADPLHHAVMELAWLVRSLPPDRREEFRKPLYVIVREANRLRRERDNYRIRASLLTRLVRYQAEAN